MLPRRAGIGPFLALAVVVAAAALLAPGTDHLAPDNGRLVWDRLPMTHTLKHLAAGLAGSWILRMLEKRRPLSSVPAEL